MGQLFLKKYVTNSSRLFYAERYHKVTNQTMGQRLLKKVIDWTGCLMPNICGIVCYRQSSGKISTSFGLFSSASKVKVPIFPSRNIQKFIRKQNSVTLNSSKWQNLHFLNAEIEQINHFWAPKIAKTVVLQFLDCPKMLF